MEGKILAAALVTLSCAYSQGSIDYSGHPEFRTVRLYNGRPDTTGEDLAVLEASHEGGGDCTDVAAAALQELVEDAQALGADGIKDVKFRGRWNWMGRVVCRPGLHGLSVMVRGTAYRR